MNGFREWRTRRICSVLLLFVAFVCIDPMPAPAADAHPPAMPMPAMQMPEGGMTPHQHQHQDQPASTGLDPHPGVKLPLDLVLSDEQGRPVRLGDLIDRPTLILPIYYSCPNVCNFLQAGVAEVVKEVGRTPGEDYRILSISFNDREGADDAQRAAAIYRKLAGRDFPPQAWRFLTGEGTTVKQLLDVAGYGYSRQGDDFIHPVASFVVSADGTIVRYLYGTRPLAKDLTLALYEAQSGRVGATIRKVVQFCFTFDAKNNTYTLNLLRISATVILACMGLFLAYLVIGGKKQK